LPIVIWLVVWLRHGDGPGLSRLQALTRLQQRLPGSCQTDGSSRRLGGKNGGCNGDDYRDIMD